MFRALWRLLVSPFMLLFFLVDGSLNVGAKILDKIFSVLAWPFRKKSKKVRFKPINKGEDFWLPQRADGHGPTLVDKYSIGPEIGETPILTPEEEFEEWYKVRAGLKESSFETRDVPEIVADMIDEDEEDDRSSRDRWNPGPVRFTPYSGVSNKSVKEEGHIKINNTSKGPRGEIVKNNWINRATFSHKLENYRKTEEL